MYIPHDVDPYIPEQADPPIPDDVDPPYKLILKIYTVADRFYSDVIPAHVDPHSRI